LASQLLKKGYDVYGTYRRSSTPNFWRLHDLGIHGKVSFIPADLTDSGSLVEALRISKPDEVYHLAAQSFVGASFETPVATGAVTGITVTALLEAIRQSWSGAKFYFAATSEMYGRTGNEKAAPLREDDPMQPLSPYAAAKLYGYWITRTYREAYGIFAVNGLLFNHESPIRGMEFVTRKVANEVAKISLGLSKQVRVGNMEAKRDWGFAPEYTESMWMMMQQEHADDFVIATGEAHSVAELVEESFGAVGLDPEKFVRQDKRFMRPLDVPLLVGDSSKARRVLGWKPKVKFRQLVKLLVGAEVSRWERWQKGERFPWDAPSYDSENRILTRSLRM
jgi:GDPmannose 4,6-dehydratase